MSDKGTKLEASMADVERGLAMFAALAADADHLMYTVIPGPPPSKARARFGRGHTYAPDRAIEERTAWALRAAFKQELVGNVAIGCVFFRPNHMRIDVDNMLKHVLDAAKGIVWHDDSQVTAVMGIVELDTADPRTLVVVAPHVSSLVRDIRRTCRRCGVEFRLPWSGSPQVYCSPTCHGKSTKQPKVHPGQGRGRKRQPPSTCRDCGADLSKRSYIRCRSCWLAARTAGVS
jgi:Holliday junction resolvase RusA-like endonuclease